jgi:coenzyme PQQ precursor peptide PqqA
MKLTWSKPEICTMDVGMEVTSYSPAELDEVDIFV